MRLTHELKVWPEFFKLVWSGDKPFELRKDDRGFSVGDKLLLREYVLREDSYTGREMTVTITSVISGFPGLLPDYVIMGFDPRETVRSGEPRRPEQRHERDRHYDSEGYCDNPRRGY
jgi:hypothetical protein